MLAILGILSIGFILVLIMSKKVSAIVALVLVPFVMGVIGGFGTELFQFMTEGIKTISATAVMFIFAILFFGILTDAGTFKPIIRWMLRRAGNDSARVAVATALLAMIVHLDGSGAVTFLVTIPALLPIYDALGMKRSPLATIVALAAGTMNVLPWGGPTLRAASALGVPVMELFSPMLIPVLAGLLLVVLLAYRMGAKERSFIEFKDLPSATEERPSEWERPRLFFVNIFLIIISISALLSGIAPPHIIFILAFSVALLINYPNLKIQAERINHHAKSALLMAGILFAAGCFTGILKGSGMIDAMAEATVAYIPNWIGSHLAVITGLVSMPASMLFDPDSFYFGILPLLGSTAAHFGVDAIEVGRAAICGQMTTGFPISPLTGSTYLLVGLTGIDLGDHQRKCFPYAFLVTVVILVVALIVGAISL